MTTTNEELESQLAAALQSLPQFADQLPDPLKPLLELAPVQGSSVVVFLHGLDETNADVAAAIAREATRSRSIYIIHFNDVHIQTSVRPGSKLDFEPIVIGGEPLSETVLRERR
jgi:hypothetical protein